MALCTPQVGLIVGSLGRQIQHAVPTLKDKNNLICSLLKYMSLVLQPVRGISRPTAVLLGLCLLGENRPTTRSEGCLVGCPAHTAVVAARLHSLVCKLVKRWQ